VIIAQNPGTLGRDVLKELTSLHRLVCFVGACQRVESGERVWMIGWQELLAP
jgi:hypothetical protein